MFTQIRLLSVITLLALILFLTAGPQAGWSRAGGGQSFASSHSSSSGGGSRGGSSGSSGWHSGGNNTVFVGGGYGGGGGGGFIFGLVFILIIVVVILMIVKGRSQNMTGGNDMQNYDDSMSSYNQGGGYGPSYGGAMGKDPSEGLNKIKASDPNFSEKVFLDRAQTAFFAIQQAWQKRNLDGGRAYLSDAMVRRYQMQLDELTQKHQHNVLENLVVGGMHITEASQEGGFDSIKVKMAASCADYTIDDQTQQIVSGSKQIQPWVEFWTFVRTTGTTTQAPPGTPGAANNKAQMCPSCGAPLSIGETGKCTYCGNEVKGMNFDWVLDLIGQASEEAG